MSSFLTEVLSLTARLPKRLLHVWVFSTARHLHTEGEIERVNRVLADVLRLSVAPNMEDWD